MGCFLCADSTFIQGFRQALKGTIRGSGPTHPLALCLPLFRHMQTRLVIREHSPKRSDP